MKYNDKLVKYFNYNYMNIMVSASI